MATKKKGKRDVEKTYPAKQFVAKLRRLADSIEQDFGDFTLDLKAEKIEIPPPPKC